MKILLQLSSALIPSSRGVSYTYANIFGDSLLAPTYLTAGKRYVDHQYFLRLHYLAKHFAPSLNAEYASKFSRTLWRFSRNPSLNRNRFRLLLQLIITLLWLIQVRIEIRRQRQKHMLLPLLHHIISSRPMKYSWINWSCPNQSKS